MKCDSHKRILVIRHSYAWGVSGCAYVCAACVCAGTRDLKVRRVHVCLSIF